MDVLRASLTGYLSCLDAGEAYKCPICGTAIKQRARMGDWVDAVMRHRATGKHQRADKFVHTQADDATVTAHGRRRYRERS